MSDLGFLEKLLDGTEVEWLPLGDVTLPTSNIRWADADRAYRYIDLTSVDRETGTISDTKEITAETAPSRAQKLVEADDLIFATTRPAQQRFCLISPEWADEVASTGYCVLRPNKSKVLPGWLLYWISSTAFKLYVEENQSGSAYPAISDGKVKEFEIPIPCSDDPEKSLAIQGEIVRILDSFTELTAELTAEHELRKKQYNHYRDQLLTFEEGEVEWKPLGDVFDISAGGDAPKGAMSPEKTEDFEIPILSNGIGARALYGWTNIAKIEQPSLTVSARGTIGWTSYREEPFFPIVRLLVLTPKTGIDLRFAYHFMKTIENGYKVPPSGIPQLTRPMIQGTPFPVPFANDQERSLAEQDRIVAILDKFDTLTTSLSEGLPREIELRQRQYEYYRDLLLSFPKPAETTKAVA